MLVLSTILLSLLSTGLTFSVIQLGLVGYSINIDSQGYTDAYYCGFEVCYGAVGGFVPDIVAFLMFTAAWSTIVTPVAIGLPLWYQSRAGHRHNYWLAPTLIVIYFVTLVFWLAGFADLAYLDGSLGGIPGAILSFAVLNWLIYTALFILSFLAIFDVLKGEWPGYLVMTGGVDHTGPELSTIPAADPEAPGESKTEADHELTA